MQQRQILDYIERAAQMAGPIIFSQLDDVIYDHVREREGAKYNFVGYQERTTLQTC
jgi:hypothetical protein